MLAACVACGVIISKLLWWLWWFPPTIRLDSGAKPVALSWFESQDLARPDTHWSELRASNSEYIVTELQRCQSHPHAIADCKFARFLIFNGGKSAWLDTLPVAPEKRVALWNAARGCVGTQAIPKTASLSGVLGELVTSRGARWGFVSAETTPLEDGKYHHLECSWPLEDTGPSAFLLRRYRYEHAGVEFLTAPLISATLMIITFVCSSMIAAVRRI